MSRSARRSTSASWRSGLALCGLLLCGAAPQAGSDGQKPAQAAPASTLQAAAATPAPQAPAPGPAPSSPAAASAPSSPAAAPAPELPSQGGFAAALEAVRRGDLPETARLCWAYLKSKERGQDADEAGGVDKTESATYYLGEALERLGYVHAGIDRYLEIVNERRAPALVPRALSALERLSRQSRSTEEAIAREGALSVAEFEELPGRLASFVHYRQAIDDLRHGYDTWALRHLDRISPETPYLPMALYARAVWRLSKGDPEAALADLQLVLGHAATPQDLRARALHSRARLLYDQGKWAEAYADLDRIDVRYEAGGEILLEKAWSKFRARDFRTALGLLHALGAPSYVDRFAPERYLLRSLIFSKFCHFRAAKRSIEMFRSRFDKEISALRAGTAPEAIPELAAAAYERNATTGAGAAHALRVRLSLERQAVGRVATWGDAGTVGTLNHFLRGLYDTKLRAARYREDQLLRPAAEQVATELLNANEQMNLLEYEVGLGIYRRVGRDARGADAWSDRKRAAIPRVSEKIYLHFDGEYWSDELPDMQFFIEDRCVD
jgi:hypothetical protein